MNSSPLLRSYKPTDIIAWKDNRSITQTEFCSHVASYKQILPDMPYVVNLCIDRYQFLVGFAAALTRGQTTLLPPNNTPGILRQIGESYPSSYYLTDNADTLEGHTGITLNIDDLSEKLSPENPIVSNTHVAAIAFTSGSTGTPRPNLKTWDSLVSIAQKTGVRIMENGNHQHMSIVATVPHQHMYGLETSIMLPIQHGWAFTSERPFFPEDVRAALSRVPSPRLLVSTPIHLRACLMEQTQLPPMEAILSATAPLSTTLAQEAEAMFQTKIIEIYGFAEAGTIATRRTSHDERWTLLDRLSLVSKLDTIELETPYHPHPIPIPDTISVHSPQEFLLEGRPGNLVNIGGHRASLDDLNYQLSAIEGVKDAVFCLPQNTQDSVTRLMAFAVAPERTKDQILSALRTKIAPVFLPRPLYLVDSLPRNATGKLPADALAMLEKSEFHRQTNLDDAPRTRGCGISSTTGVTVTIGQDHPSLAGHFPGNPIVPGVVILSEVLDAIRKTEGTSISLLEVQTVKFHSPLGPDEQLRISLNPRHGEHRTFSCSVGTTLIASGELRYRVRETEPSVHP